MIPIGKLLRIACAAALWTLGLGVADARAESWVCARIQDWSRAETYAVSPQLDVYRREAWSNYAHSEKRKIAREFFSAFLNQKLAVTEIEHCLAGRNDRGDVFDFLHTRFLEQELARVSSVPGPASQAFMKALHAQYQSVAGIFFRMTGHQLEPSPTALKGGFRDNSGSVYVDWIRATPDEWQVILIHELLHALDRGIPEAAQIIDDPTHAAHASQLIHSQIAFSALSNPDLQFLQKWIQAGLDRGLFSEYRAWVATLAIYREGLTAGLWRPIPWMEGLLRECPAGPSLESCFYRLLDRRSQNPAHGIFSESPLREVLESRRAELRNGSPPLLGALEAMGAPIRSAP